MRQRKGGSASSDKFEESTFLRALRALQNGKFEFTPVSLQERRLYCQAGFELCLLFRTSPKESRKFVRFQWDVKLYPSFPTFVLA